MRTATENDAAAIDAIDARYTTNRAYRVAATETGFDVTERPLEAPYSKRYTFERRPGDVVLVGELGGSVVGVAGIRLETWNRRARLEHLYVTSAARGRGVGAALVREALQTAAARGARCLWCETQDTNPDAVDFYRHAGFRLAGLDTTLYDPVTTPGETALFLAHDV